MNTQGRCFLLIVVLVVMLSGCLGSIWTGANLVYTRHTLYEKVEDFSLSTRAYKLLYTDKLLKQPGCYLDLAVFNDDLLVAGHVPNIELRKLVEHRLKDMSGYRKMYIQVAISDDLSNGVVDTWITTKIRGKIIADSTINPDVFKIITVDSIVYVMGDAQASQASRVLNIAKNTDRVVRVVKLLKYYNLSKTPAPYK